MGRCIQCGSITDFSSLGQLICLGCVVKKPESRQFRPNINQELGIKDIRKFAEAAKLLRRYILCNCVNADGKRMMYGKCDACEIKELFDEQLIKEE